tara:strand:+ start:2536 stop:3360 length:825 start_codon:yes stop_codon:yes gene_type:complete
MIEMISTRLTKTQKVEILEAFRAGGSTNALAEKYKCVPNTINRTVKSLLSDNEYKLLKEKRSKISIKKGKLVDNQIDKQKNKDIEQTNDLILLKEKVKEENLSKIIDQEFENPELKKISSLTIESQNCLSPELGSENQDNPHYVATNNENLDKNFELIAPLISVFDQEKQHSDFEILGFESLPEIVYMIVDKKVELDLQSISDLPEWSFLPDNELQRKAILLFANQRSAKRSCLRSQRVIKVPNTSIFKFSKSYLISKGITRLILEDSIIALDN